MNYKAEKTYWVPMLQHYKQTGILEVMAQANNIDLVLFDYLGFHLAYNVAVIMTSLKL